MMFFAPGTLIGADFVLGRELKSGGFGVVFEAIQQSTGQRRALKILKTRLSEAPKVAERFRVEAFAASLVNSEHVVQVVASGVDQPSGLMWLAMEYLVGDDLAGWIAHHGPMPPHVAWMVLRHVCHALAAAHQAGIVHRDLKPENIFLAHSSRADTPLTAKVLDFGIAKVLEGASRKTTEPIGSWAWLAPEQAVSGRELTPGTDIWALGLVGFYLFTGRSYWLTMQRGFQNPELIHELEARDFEQASARAARLGYPGLIPPAFDAWFARCVSKTNRFKNGGEALAELDAGVRSQTPVPGSPSAPPKKHALNKGALVGLAALGLAVTGLVLSQNGSSPRNPIPSDLAPSVTPSPTSPAIFPSATQTPTVTSTAPEAKSRLPDLDPPPPPPPPPPPRVRGCVNPKVTCENGACEGLVADDDRFRLHLAGIIDPDVKDVCQLGPAVQAYNLCVQTQVGWKCLAQADACGQEPAFSTGFVEVTGENLRNGFTVAVRNESNWLSEQEIVRYPKGLQRIALCRGGRYDFKGQTRLTGFTYFLEPL